MIPLFGRCMGVRFHPFTGCSSRVGDGYAGDLSSRWEKGRLNVAGVSGLFQLLDVLCLGVAGWWGGVVGFGLCSGVAE